MRRLALLIPFLLAACAAPAPIVVAPEEPAPVLGPEFGALIVQGGTLTEAGQPLSERRISSLQGVFPGGQNGGVLFAATSGDSTLLFLAEGSAVRRLHAAASPATYTAVWSPDGAAASFGHYRPGGNASPGRVSMGAGDVLQFEGNAVSRVGCSASRAVLAWAPDGQLLVRNSDNLYLVDRDGCGTAATVDARRMHGLSVSPDARHLAFVHRELEYNRTTRAYEADSTFRLTELDGTDPKTIVNFRYRPKRLAWKPDGLELAFDVKASPDVGRAISIFDVASGATAFLHPPAVGSEEFGANWSPDGARIAYYRGAEGGSSSIWVRTFAIGFPEAIQDTDGARIEGWMDADHLILSRADGTVVVHSLATGQSTDLAKAEGVIRVRRLR